VLHYPFFFARDSYRRAFTAELTMNDDDDKTVIQTEEDRKKLEKRLLGEKPGNDAEDDPTDPGQAGKTGD